MRDIVGAKPPTCLILSLPKDEAEALAKPYD